MLTTEGVRLDAHGGPECLTLGSMTLRDPGPGEVLVEVSAAGVNFIDVYQRTGLYPVALPVTLGLEGAGRVVATGPDVDAFAIGDRVAWYDAQGSYARHVVVQAGKLAPVPDGVDLETAAASMLQGLTAQMLTTDVHPLAAGEVALVHAAAGGVGLLLVQLAKAAGAVVVATVGSAAKAGLARGAGADHVIVIGELTTEGIVSAVEAAVGPRAVRVVYDGVGRTTFAASLAVLRRRGLLVSFGNASGPVDPISPLVLSQNGSLYLTRPTLFHYVDTPQTLHRGSTALFEKISSGALDVRVGERVPLAEAARAHELLQGRSTTGKVLLLP